MGCAQTEEINARAQVGGRSRLLRCSLAGTSSVERESLGEAPQVVVGVGVSCTMLSFGVIFLLLFSVCS